MAAAAGPGPEELILLEKLLGLKKGNKYGALEARKVPVLQTNNGPSLTGLTTIATHLVKQAKKEQLLGSTAEEKAIVQQWLEYRVTQISGHSNKEDIRIILKDLNLYLEDKVYLAGNNFTLADILMYYGLHHIIPLLPVGKEADLPALPPLPSKREQFPALSFLGCRNKDGRRTKELPFSLPPSLHPEIC
ncbi:eukaryotic translation elongation factor 1 epsilon-1 isoform X1 [Mauremys reevesii]|uniref:eukaryotic translation elongation factor 1 epsilon-1 isoform X1 n=1 Tax=Mauremys reevesii TaxID=260615 RepID=UPI00193ED731|nr:eukaryotic translation elongation factor 1 epsilon-1 isoform X1 [Mauremys reevesii]